eukprot:TRINITY_DN20431_c0_g1_i1.p1 TRINITY_DN20431_c0_g1~~TRINITY_DN20431_c0_g1_i1.p1  ORF type:complete len:796 (-),score=214.31 TRINITY_DN20431_c0_g1_i1:20-2242(-)
MREVDLLRQQVSELRIKANEVEQYRSQFRDGRDEVRSLRVRISELESQLGSAVRELELKASEVKTVRQDLLRVQTELTVDRPVREVHKEVITEIPVTKEIVVVQPKFTEVVKEVYVEVPAESKVREKRVVVPDPQLQARIAALEAELAHQNTDEHIRVHVDHISSLEQKLRTLTATHEDTLRQRDSELAELKEGMLDQKNSNSELSQKVANLERELAVKTREISDLHAQLDLRDNRESALEARIVQLHSTATASSALPGGALTSEVIELRNKVLTTESDIRIKDNLIKELREQMKIIMEKSSAAAFSPEHAERTSQLERELVARTEELNETRRHAQETERMFSKANEEIRILNATINQLQAELSSLSNHALVINRDEHIAVLERKLSLASEEYVAREKQLRAQLQAQLFADKDEQISILQRKYTLAQQELEVFVRSKAAENEALRQKQAAALEDLKLRDHRITELEEEVRNLRIKVREAEYQGRRTATLMEIISKKDEDIRELIEKVAERRAEVGGTKVVIQTVEVCHDEAKIAELLAQIKKLEREVSIREGTIHELRSRAECTNSHLTTRIQEKIVVRNSGGDAMAKALEAELASTVRMKDAQIAQLRSRVGYLVQELATRINACNDATERAASLDTTYTNKFQDVEILRARILGYETELRRLREPRVVAGPIVPTSPVYVQQPQALLVQPPQQLLSTAYPVQQSRVISGPSYPRPVASGFQYSGAGPLATPQVTTTTK